MLAKLKENEPLESNIYLTFIRTIQWPVAGRNTGKKV